MSRLHLLTRSAATLLRTLEFLISGLILAIFSYFLAALSRRDGAIIPNWQKAVEGMSGAAVIYTAFAVILTCFLGGITFFAFIAVVLDVLFCGCMIAIAILTRAGSHSCGPPNDSPLGTDHHTSCQLQRVVFVVAIIAAILFFISVLMQVALSRSHKREKRYGPGPSNNYTSGSGRRRGLFQRRKKTGDREMDPVAPSTHDNNVPSNAETYGGPATRYAEPTTATNHGSELDGAKAPGSGSHPGMAHGGTTGVYHDPEPYANVQNGGYVHQV